MGTGAPPASADDESADTVVRGEPATVHERVPPRPRPSASMPTAAPSAPGSGSQPQAPGRARRWTGPVVDTTTIVSPLAALHRDELLRTRRFVLLGLIIAALTASSVPLLPGDPLTGLVLLGSTVIACAGLLYLLHRTHSPSTFHGPGLWLAWWAPAGAFCAAIPYFGAFSPVPMVIVLGTYFVGLGQNRRLATALYLTCALTQAVVGFGIAFDLLEDRGIVRADYLPQRALVVAQLLVQMVLAVTFAIARLSRRTALQALGELERAVRAASQREALLHEARQDLERALKAGRSGRFSEQTLGNYRLGQVIGRGAMGEVYEATDVRSGEAAAVKLLSQASLGNATHVRRFLRELEAAAAIDAPNVVRVLEVGETPLPYLVMERLEGKDLAEILRGQRTMKPAEVVQLVEQVGAGITAAATAGIVHRDLKPQNLFLHLGTTWKILDFGVSRVAHQSDTLTSGHVIGTPAYMAPEQARGTAVDHRADLYGLAAIAYRALTGRPPFAAGEIAETLYRVVHTAPLRPSWLAELPEEVDLVLAIGMAKDPGHRFASAGELALALADALARKLPEAVRARGKARIEAGAWARP